MTDMPGALARELSDTEGQLTAARATIETLTQWVKTVERERDDAQARYETTSALYRDLASERMNVKDRHANDVEHIGRLEKAWQAAMTEGAKLAEQIAKHEQDAHANARQIEDLTAQNDELTRLLEAAQSKFSAMASKIENATLDVDALRTEIKSAKELHGRSVDKIINLNARILAIRDVCMLAHWKGEQVEPASIRQWLKTISP